MGQAIPVLSSEHDTSDMDVDIVHTLIFNGAEVKGSLFVYNLNHSMTYIHHHTIFSPLLPNPWS